MRCRRLKEVSNRNSTWGQDTLTLPRNEVSERTSEWKKVTRERGRGKNHKGDCILGESQEYLLTVGKEGNK